jgi:hypothetical protein
MNTGILSLSEQFFGKVALKLSDPARTVSGWILPLPAVGLAGDFHDPGQRQYFVGPGIRQISLTQVKILHLQIVTRQDFPKIVQFVLFNELNLHLRCGQEHPISLHEPAS